LALFIRKDKNSDKTHSNIKQASMTKHSPNAFFHGKGRYKDFRDIREPIFLEEIKEMSRMLGVNTQK